MAEQLTKEQILLLNNLMYTTNEGPLRNIAETDASTVGEFVDSINIDKLEAGKDYGSYIKGEDWRNLITAIKNDEQLMNIQIAEVHVDNSNDGGGGVSTLFVDTSTNEAIVTFRGTGQGEWKDNFIGGGETSSSDGVSTPQQENALEWYRSLDLESYYPVTVTGHSKGGNKAKYITVLDDSVDRCMAFDGQGFSDEFIEKYNGDIAFNQDKITNYNAEGDFVNILLNDIGNTKYYKGYDCDSFAENHCPNTYFNFRSDGSYKMVEGKQDPAMAELDKFLNNYLRTLSPEEKKATLEMIGEMVQEAFSNNEDKILDICDILTRDENKFYTINLLNYLRRYTYANPDFREVLNLDIIRSIRKSLLNINASWLNVLIDGYSAIENWIDPLEIDNGADMKIESIKLKSCDFSILLENNRQNEEKLAAMAKRLKAYAGSISSINKNLDWKYVLVKRTINKIESQVKDEAEDCQSLKTTLNGIHQSYDKAEKRIVASV